MNDQEKVDIATLIKERQKTHGPFIDYAEVATDLKDAVAGHIDKAPPHVKEGLHMIFSKIARIATGDPCEPDHWVDIQGYAKAVELALEENKTPQPVLPDFERSSYGWARRDINTEVTCEDKNI